MGKVKEAKESLGDAMQEAYEIGYAEGLIGATEETEVYDPVNPNHYTDMKMSPAEYCFINSIPFLEANVIKYICRHKNKNRAEDIKKAIKYCELILEWEYNEGKADKCQ